MNGLPISEYAKLLLPMAKMVWPRAKRIYRERKAGQMPIMEGTDLLDQEFQKTLDRITGGSVDNSWWKNLIDAIEQPLVAPDFLKISAVQEWLSDEIVQTHLKAIARARVMGSRSDSRPFLTILHSKYAEKTGENRRFANGPIRVVVAVLVAGYLASIQPYQSLAAFIQASANENRAGIEGLHERFDQIGSDSIVVKAHNEEVTQRLSRIIKKRSFDAATARQEIRNLAKHVWDGDLRRADTSIRSEVLFWAARIHAGDVTTLTSAKDYHKQLLELKSDADTRILDTLILETEGDPNSALRILRNMDTPDGRTVLFIVLCRKKSRKDALEWFDSQVGRNDPLLLTGWGWSYVAITLAEERRWEEAAEYLFKARMHTDEWPDIAFIEGLVVTAMMLPEEHRHYVWTMSVIHPYIITLEGFQIDLLRARAIDRFTVAEERMIEIGQEERAKGVGMWRLWLRLTDRQSQTEQEACREVQDGLTDEKRALDFLPFALSYNISFDPFPIRNYLDQRKSLGGLNEVETYAELQLAEHSMTPSEFAIFLEKEEPRFTNILLRPGSKAMLSGRRIEALVGDAQTSRARHLLEERKEEFEGHDYERLQAMISAREGDDPRAKIEDIYRQTHELIDLQNLVTCLGRAGDWRALKPLLGEMFRRERTAKNALRLVECMRRVPDANDNSIVEFLEKNEDLLPENPDLKCEMAWALFRLGRWRESTKINDELLEDRHGHTDITLDINLAILLGESERFATIIDREKHRSRDLEPRLLMLLATIAAEVDATVHRAFEFAEIAASKAPDNPHVLTNAYFLAVQLGREDDVKVGKWMSRAVALSDEKGPVWKADMRKVAEMASAHRERSRRIEEGFLHGDIPLCWAADALNMPLSRILLDIPRNNETLDDYRRLLVVPILSGARLPVATPEIK